MPIILNKKYKRICLIGNQHALLQYLLLSSLEDVENTFFLWNYVGIPTSIISLFKNSGTIIPSHKRKNEEIVKSIKGKSSFFNAVIKCFQLFFYYHIYYPIKFPFIFKSNLEFWGHDHVLNAHCFFRNHPFILLEDGILNYGPYPYRQTKHSLLFFKRLIAGKNYCEYLRYAGDESNCVRIYLTGLSDKGEVLSDKKVVIKSFEDMWKDANLEKRSFINKVFGISPDMIHNCSPFKTILLTEPFSETGDMSEIEKVSMFDSILNMIKDKNVCIKPHPREITDYSLYFPNNYVLNTRSPMQLLTLNGIRFETAYSIMSTALFDFPYRIKVCVIGSEIHPVLYTKYPESVSDKLKNMITNSNIVFIDLNDNGKGRIEEKNTRSHS